MLSHPCVTSNPVSYILSYIIPLVISSLRYLGSYNLSFIFPCIIYEPISYILYHISYHTFFPALSLPCIILDPLSYLLFFHVLSPVLFPYILFPVIHFYCIISSLRYLRSYILSYMFFYAFSGPCLILERISYAVLSILRIGCHLIVYSVF